MTPEAQRIAIAEACGWKLNLPNRSWPNSYWTNPTTKVLSTLNELPDYLSDLNAMHEAEKVLPNRGENLIDQYSYRLGQVVDSNRSFANINATATQRAEAFLRTLNLWDDSK